MGGIRRYYDQKNEARVKIDVPEWGISFYVGPLTVLQFERIAKAETDGERNREVILTCAKDEKGAPALNAEDQEDLARYGTTDIVARVSAQIMEACNTFRTDTEKKS